MTMKKFCLTLMLCLVAVAATRAQSFIITKSADTLRVYDVEIGYTSVYFKSSRDKEAPLERLSKTKIDHLILVDGQQFTFEGRTPVKEENKTYSVLLCGDRGTAEEKPRRKSQSNNDQWSFANKQTSLSVEYAGLFKFDGDIDMMNCVNLSLKLPIVELGLLRGSEDDNGTTYKITQLRLGAHYSFWINQRVIFDLATGYVNIPAKSKYDGDKHMVGRKETGYGSLHFGVVPLKKWRHAAVICGYSIVGSGSHRGTYGMHTISIGALFKF